MIIRECYVDGLGGSDDLHLDQLRGGVNVVVGPIAAKMKELRQFIPAMLLGEIKLSGIQLESVTGSLSSEVESAPIELIRIANRSTTEVHFVDTQGRPANNSPLSDRVQSIDAEHFLSLYTDSLSLSDRLTWWNRTGTTQRLTGPVTSTVAEPVVNRSIREQRLAKVHELRDRVTKLQRRQNHLTSKLEANQLDRQQYLKHKELQAEVASRSEQLHQSIRQSREQLKLLTTASALAPHWARRAQIQASLQKLRAINAHAKDLPRVRRLDKKIRALRRRLSDLRDKQQAPPQRVTTDPIEDLLQTKATILHHETRIAKIQVAFERDRVLQSANNDFELICQLEEAAAALSAARSGHEANLASTGQSELNGIDAPLTPPASDDDNANEIRHRIESLKSKTRELLHRRVLSPFAILALGVFFSCGIAMILGSLIIDFGGYNFTIGLVGLTAIGAVAFLKNSFEQPALEEIERHRAQIDQVIREIEQAEIENDSGPQLAVYEETPSLEEKTASLSSSQAELEHAKQLWTDLLGSLELPPNTPLTDAIENLQLRANHSGSVPNHEIRKLEAELAQHQSSLSDWQQQAADSLNRSITAIREVDVEVVLEWLQAEKSSPESESSEANHEWQQEITTCQQELKRHKRKRNKILARAGVEEIGQLRAKIRKRSQIKPLKKELAALQIQIDADLHHQSVKTQITESQITELLQANKEASLPHQIEKQQAEIQARQQEKSSNDAECKRLEQALQQFVTNRSAATWRQERDALARDLAAQTQQLMTEEIGLEIIDRLPLEATQCPKSEGLTLASQLLHDVGRDEVQIDYDADAQAFLYVDDQGARPLRELPELDARLVILSLQFAGIILQNRSETPLPAVFSDESFSEQPSDDLSLAKLFREVAKRDNQIFVFTSRDDVEKAFTTAGVATLRISAPLADTSDSDEISRLDKTFAAPTTESDAQPTQRVPEPPQDVDWIPVEYQVAAPPRPTAPISPINSLPPCADGSPSTTPAKRSGPSSIQRQDSIIEISWEQQETAPPPPSEPPPSEPPPSEPPPSTDNLVDAETNRPDRSNTPPSKWHRLDAPHPTPPSVIDNANQTMKQSVQRLIRGRDEMPDWWPD
ncbi:MAG: hypothetical protein GY768_06710 [Planctomycetaceae bacterium]|nr:hypothetical protein [Planctomycetaceae bacterium]